MTKRPDKSDVSSFIIEALLKENRWTHEGRLLSLLHDRAGSVDSVSFHEMDVALVRLVKQNRIQAYGHNYRLRK